MANQWGPVSQTNPGAASLTDAYTVPAATQFVGLLRIANRSAVATTFRVAVAIAGAADDPKQYLAYDVAIGGNAVFEMVLALGATDVVRVYATLATLTFTIKGVRKT